MKEIRKMQKTKVLKSTVDKIRALQQAQLNGNGQEINDPMPVEISAGLLRPPSTIERIRQILRNELSQQAAAQEMETFEEANDFDVDDSFEVDDPVSPYDVVDMEEEFVRPGPGQPEKVDQEPEPVPEEVEEKPTQE